MGVNAENGTPMSSAPSPEAPSISELGRGLFWQDMPVGASFRTPARTVTEGDVVGFVTLTGMIDGTFLDATLVGPMGPRPAPGALTYALSEGFIIQTLIRGTGIAMLSCTLEALKPVHIGDTLHAEVEITGVRPTSKAGRAIVDAAVTVLNQRAEAVLTYTSRRMIAGRPTPAE